MRHFCVYRTIDRLVSVVLWEGGVILPRLVPGPIWMLRKISKAASVVVAASLQRMEVRKLESETIYYSLVLDSLEEAVEEEGLDIVDES
jgi:hypothetical protein